MACLPTVKIDKEDRDDKEDKEEGRNLMNNPSFAPKSSWSSLSSLSSLSLLALLIGCENQKVTYETVPVREGSLLKVVAAQGRVEALTEVDISSKVDGRIRRMTLKEGDRVTKGHVVVELDDELAKAACDEALARAKEAYLNLVRAKKMRQEKAIPQAELDTAQVQHEVMQAKKKASEVFLRDLTVTAPIPGKVIRKFVEDGEFARAGAPLMTVADLSKIIVRAEVDQTDISFLKVGQPASITADGFAGRSFTGTVLEMGQSVGVRKVRHEDPSKIQDRKVLETKIEMKNASELKLGMTVEVKVEVFRKDKVLLVPKRSLHTEKNQTVVEVLVGSTPVKKPLMLGGSDDWDVEVVKGLKAGEIVILRSQKP